MHPIALYPTFVFSVDGGWGSWTEWSTCGTTCGAARKQVRHRPCDNPAPSAGGKMCQGSMIDWRHCNTSQCPGKRNNGLCQHALQALEHLTSVVKDPTLLNVSHKAIIIGTTIYFNASFNNQGRPSP